MLRMYRFFCLTLVGILFTATPGLAQQTSSDSLSELSRRINILSEEIERLNLGEAAVKADTSLFGFGPAASKIYRTERGVSIGGYGEGVYKNYAAKKQDGSESGKVDNFDWLRAIIYVGYKFNDKWLLNTEFEFEHASTGVAGSVSAEFVHVEYLHKPGFNIRAGLLLMPMGLVNELHEPTVFMGVERPMVEKYILPTTWRENGIGVFGQSPDGVVSYRTYLVNGMKGSGFSSSGLRGGRQKGSKAKSDDFGWTGRLDLTPRPGIVFGSATYLGKSGQDMKLGTKNLNVTTSIFEGHVDIRYQGLWLSALGALAKVGDAAEFNQAQGLTGNASVGDELRGFYVQAGYDLLTRSKHNDKQLMPYFRYEKYNTQSSVPSGFTQNPSNNVNSLTVGMAFYPESRIVFKGDYKIVKNASDTGVNQVNAALGYIF